MKTTIEVEEGLITAALQATGLTTTDTVVEMALQLLIQIKQQEVIKTWRGKLSWEGDLDTMRRDR